MPTDALLQRAPVAQLPVELVESLNQAYFLHILATDPNKVLPPGKSLLAMMTHARIGGPTSTAPASQLENRVRQVVHGAFWTEATECLSSPNPSVQLPRIKLLYNDLAEALANLLPPDHRVIQTLKAPLAPTSAPLLSAVHFLRELLDALRQRCAPARDSAINDLHRALDEAPTSKPDNSHLAQLIVNTVKSTLNLAEDMKSDINAFVLGSLTEDQLKGVIVQEAKLNERELVLQLWEGKDAVREAWRTWVAELPSSNDNDNKWVLGLVQALRSDKIISCKPPRWTPPSQEAPNALPPQFFFSSPELLYIQNYMQAIVIAATLRSLTRISPGASSDFMQRVWALLKAEIDEEDGEYISETKLVHLEDEVVRARRLYSPESFTPKDEKNLRAAVDRTINSTDPVFLLLQGRLVAELQTYLTSSLDDEFSPRSVVPEKMQSGGRFADGRPEKRTRLVIEDSEPPVGGRSTPIAISAIKGFEDAVLATAVEDMFRKISLSVVWVKRVWGDLV